ncbi:MAG: AI-2E family transporter [Candidatus Rokubacteria bacterium]|nr:AI-2E family transporter [Candidatus Rokubacteria bacterium]
MNQADDRFYPRVFALATAGVLAVALFKILEPFIGSILWSLLLAFLLFPANLVLRRRLNGRRGAAAVLLTLGMTVIVVAPAPLLTVAFASQAAELFGQLQRLVARYQITGAGDLLRIPIISQAMEWAEAVAPVTAEQVHAWLVSGAQTLLQQLVSLSGSFVVGALGALVAVAVTLFLLFFFLRDGEELVRKAALLIPLGEARRAQLVDHIAAVTRAVVFGALLTALIQGTLVGTAFALVRLPSPVVFGALAVLASLLPLVGAALVWVPAAGVLAFQGRWGAAAFVVIWGVAVVSMADNVVRPLFISGQARISTMPVFLGLAGGIAAFGPIGLVLGPVVVAVVLALLRFAEEARAGEVPASAPPPP